MNRTKLLLLLCPSWFATMGATQEPTLTSDDPERAHEGLRFFNDPGPLSAGAVVEDWPGFLGPRRDGHSRETGLRKSFPEEGLVLVWSREIGGGYAGPAIVGERLVFTHREGNETLIDCLEASTGRRFWQHRRPCEYSGRFIRDGGPRATPTIAGGRVFVHGVEGVLCCLELESGELLWQRNFQKDFGSGDDFFGVVSSPLVHEGLLIQQVGANEGATVVALDVATGEERWRAENGWGPSCASPVVGILAGRKRLFVLAGGESRPPVGGLLVLDPKSGEVAFNFSFRSRRELSVVGATPIVGDGFVLVTDGYSAGTVALEIDAKEGLRPRWRNRMGFEFTNPLYVEGRVWAVDGVSGRAGAITCLDPESGEELRRRDIDWLERVYSAGSVKELSLSIGQGSILAVDGDLLCLGDDGALLWIETSAGAIAIRDRTRLFHALQAWTPPVVNRGLLYVCQNNRERFGVKPEPPRLLCFDLRAVD